jgi:hypothetical protein
MTLWVIFKSLRKSYNNVFLYLNLIFFRRSIKDITINNKIWWKNLNTTININWKERQTDLSQLLV